MNTAVHMTIISVTGTMSFISVDHMFV